MTEKYGNSSGVKGYLTKNGRKMRHVKSAYSALSMAVGAKEWDPGLPWEQWTANTRKYDGLAKEPLERVREDRTDFNEIEIYAKTQHPDKLDHVTAIRQARKRVWRLVQADRAVRKA